ncbi:MAG: hypothetical protein WBN32_15090 [Woeseia sp.]
MKRFLCHAALLIAVCVCLPLNARADAAQSSPDFARVDTGSDRRPRALQVAVVRYEDPANRNSASVDLIGAVHIADRAYYAELNERFRDYDVLLYELVVANPDGREEVVTDDKSLLTSLQINMKDALGLSFQLDEIDYRAANFVHADFSADMLRDSMEERGESLYVYFWRLFYSAIDDYARDPLGLQNMQLMSMLAEGSEEDAMKIAIAYEMVKATRIGDILGSEQGSAIIAARNEHAVEVLQEQIATGATRIGIFYGAAHMVDLDQRLVQDLGLEAVDTEWLDAWLFRRSEAQAE